jgi:hydrogenase-4 component E
MTGTAYSDLLELAAGAVLIFAVIVLWRKDLMAILGALALQGVALALVAGVLAAHEHDRALGVVAGLVLVAKGAVIPNLLRRLVRHDPGNREGASLANVSASLVGAAALVIVAFVASGKIAALSPSLPTRLAPIGLGTVLLGFFVLVTRRKALSQIVGLLLIDNGIALLAFLLTAGVPLIVELGASLDVLLVVIVLRVLTLSMHRALGAFDLDQLRELHD